MRQVLFTKRICAVLFTTGCLMLSAAGSAHAEKGKSSVTGLTKQHARGGDGFVSKDVRNSRLKHLKRQRLRKHRRLKGFALRRDRHRYRTNLRVHYALGYYGGYARTYWDRKYYGPVPGSRTEARPAAPPDPPVPVRPKWIHIGGVQGPYQAKAPYPRSDIQGSCLSVKTDIMVDGKLSEALGEVCLASDGAWVFMPSEKTD